MKSEQLLTLTDIRDEKQYNIVKAEDGRCWMAQSLKLEGKNLTPQDSNISSNFTSPTPNNPGFDDQDTNPESYCGYSSGCFYNWLASTAGSQIALPGEAPYSICPYGWKLPSQNDWSKLLNSYGNITSLQNSAVNIKNSLLYGHGSSYGGSCFESSTYYSGSGTGASVHRYVFCNVRSNSSPAAEVGVTQTWQTWAVQIRCVDVNN